MIKLYFLRHFPTEANNTNCWCGAKSDLNIDKSKISNFKSLIEEIQKHTFDYVYLSPLKRCSQTFKQLNLFNKPIIDSRLIERTFGLLEQKPCIESEKLLLANWIANTDLNKGVEKIQDIYFDRLLPFIKDLKKLPDGSTVLIIAHSWIGRLLKYHFTKNEKEIEVAPKNGQLLEFDLVK